jgi:hypothetical protein
MGRVGAAGAKKQPPPASALQLRRHQLRDLHRVQRSALAEVVVGDEQREPVLDRLVGADTPDVRRVLAGRLERRRDVGQGDTRRAAEQLRRALDRDRAGETGVDLEGVAGEDRDTDTGAGDLQPASGSTLKAIGRL